MDPFQNEFPNNNEENLVPEPILSDPNLSDDQRLSLLNPNLSAEQRIAILDPNKLPVIISLMVNQIQEKRKAMRKEIQEKMNNKGEEKSSSLKRRAETLKREKTELKKKRDQHQPFIIKDLPSINLSPYIFLMRLRNLIRQAVKDSIQPSQQLLSANITYEFIFPKYPYPWRNLSIQEMVKKGFNDISGELMCNKCGGVAIVSLDWRECFVKVAAYMFGNLIFWGDETYTKWTYPDIPIHCETCKKGKLLPSIIPSKDTNWYFIFFTHMSHHIPDASLVTYLGSQFVELSEMPSQKELIFKFYLAILYQLDPGGGWTMMRNLFVNDQIKVTVADDKDPSSIKSVGATEEN